MKRKLAQNNIVVKKSSLHGYGVFANKNIKKGEKIEECYFLLSRKGDKAIDNYYFDAKGRYALLLGYGSIYNHSEDPNADYTLNIKDRVATIVADRGIRKGEEIYVSYGDEWFSSRGKKSKNLRKK